MEKLKEELKIKFNEDIKNKIEIEKSKLQVELDNSINKEQLLQEKYNDLKLK
jgi:hypothetical protein